MFCRRPRMRPARAIEAGKEAAPGTRARSPCLDRRTARLRGLPPAQRGPGSVPDHDDQRRVRACEPDPRPGHGEDHAEDVVGQHGERLGVGPRRFPGQSARSSVPGEQLLHLGPRQRPELLRVGGAGRLRQRHLGVFRRDQPAFGERLHQHHARRHRAGRDVPPRRLARPRHPRHRAWAAVARDRGDGAGSADWPQSLPDRRCQSHHRQACRYGAVDARRVHVGGRALARARRPARSTRPASRSSKWTCCMANPGPGTAGRRTTHSR